MGNRRTLFAYFSIFYLGACVTFADAWFPYSALALAAYVLPISALTLYRTRQPRGTS